MNCSIIIRAYNEEKYIGRLLEGIKQQTVQDVEIILVDSGSTDKTVAIAESFGAKVVHIPSAEFTFGRSLNFGVKSAAREFIVIASAHVYPVYPDWLETLLRPFQDEQVPSPTANSADMKARNIRSIKFFISGIPTRATLTKSLRFATTPILPSAKACGTCIPTTKR
jgi:glycosyltransferase involved in cell wall biosynthesis